MGAVLTAGLGLSGLAAASSSGAATPPQAAAAAQGSVLSAVSKAAPGHHGGPLVVCFMSRKPGDKPGLPALPGPGKGIKVLPGKPGGTPGRTPAKVTIVVKDGKAYINGKEVPLSKLTSGCPAKVPGGVPGTPGTVTGDGGPSLSSSGAPGGDEQGLTESSLAG